MPSSYSPLGFILQETGENETTWGDFLNTGGLSLIDAAIRGRVAFVLSGPKTLTSTNGVDTEGRKAILHATSGTGGTVTIPGYSKVYVAINDTTGDMTVTSGGVENAVVASGDSALVVCDGSGAVRTIQLANFSGVSTVSFGAARLINVGTPTSNTDAANKLYADNLAFTANAGILPGQVGNAGKVLSTDGTTATWDDAIPPQTGNGGKFLTTNGTDAAWLALGAAAEVLTGDGTKPITGDALFDAVAGNALTYASTIAWDTATGINKYVVLTGNPIIDNPTNLHPNVTYSLELVQDATGTRIPVWNAPGSIWDFGAAGIPILQTGAGKADKVYFEYNARTGKCDANFRRGA